MRIEHTLPDPRFCNGCMCLRDRWRCLEHEAPGTRQAWRCAEGYFEWQEDASGKQWPRIKRPDICIKEHGE